MPTRAMSTPARPWATAGTTATRAAATKATSSTAASTSTNGTGRAAAGHDPAGMFGAMSVYGFVTKRDLTKLGSLLFMALIGLIIGGIALAMLVRLLDWARAQGLPLARLESVDIKRSLLARESAS